MDALPIPDVSGPKPKYRQHHWNSVQRSIDPEREVIISLGANALAWLVGVFITILHTMRTRSMFTQP